MPKEDLLKRVWAGTYVTKTALKVCIREIRQALGDTVVTPHYIETVGQQGYRFVGHTDRKPTAASFVGAPPQDGPIVGRAQDVALLYQWLAEANRGIRQCVFLTGEAGIGKTTLVDLFLTSLQADDHGGMAERLKAPVLKIGRVARPSGVRIPLPPLFPSYVRECRFLRCTSLSRVRFAEGSGGGDVGFRKY